jgi:hypothetical protein
MAENPQITPELARWIEAADSARARLGCELASLRRSLSVPTQVAQSLRRHPYGWLAGVLGTGLAATLLLRRGPAPARKSRGFRGLLVTAALAAARPVVKSWLSGQLKQLVASHLPPKFSSPSAYSANSSFPTRP